MIFRSLVAWSGLEELLQQEIDCLLLSLGTPAAPLPPLLELPQTSHLIQQLL